MEEIVPEPYTPPGSTVAYVVPTLDDPADGPRDFRQFADSIPPFAGPALPIHKVSADYTLTKDDMSGIVQFDTTAGDLKVTVPADADMVVPVGSVVVVSNVGSTRKKKVSIIPASGVTVKDPADRDVQQYNMVSLIKIDTNFWLINAGSSGTNGPSVPLPPTLVTAQPGPARAVLTWDKPADDGGSPLQGYTSEWSLDGGEWTLGGQYGPDALTGSLDALPPNVLVRVRMKAENENGKSEPSNVLQVTPDPSTIDPIQMIWASVGKFTITNHDAKYVYTATADVGTATVDGATVTVSDPNGVAIVTCTYQTVSVQRQAIRKAYSSHFVVTQPDHCDCCGTSPCGGCCGGGTYYDCTCDQGGGCGPNYLACCTCGYYEADDFRSQGFTWSGGGSLPPAPDGNEWWRIG
jgi:hypothetical protein